MSRKKRKREGGKKRTGKNTLMGSDKMKFKMSRIKTHSRSTRITELDRIPSRVYAGLEMFLGGPFFLPISNQYAVSTYPNYCEGNNVRKPCMSFET